IIAGLPTFGRGILVRSYTNGIALLRPRRRYCQPNRRRVDRQTRWLRLVAGPRVGLAGSDEPEFALATSARLPADLDDRRYEVCVRGPSAERTTGPTGQVSPQNWKLGGSHSGHAAGRQRGDSRCPLVARWPPAGVSAGRLACGNAAPEGLGSGGSR